MYQKGEFISTLYEKNDFIAFILPIGCYEHTYTVTTYHYTDWFQNGEKIGTSYNGSSQNTYSSVVCDNGAGGSSPGGGGSTTQTSINHLGDEETIKDEADTDCVSEIISKIKDGDFGNDKLIKILRDLFDSNEDINIEISEDMLSSSNDGFFRGQHVGDINYYVFTGEIVLNSQYSSTATEDWILATIIHEFVHGYINFCETKVNIGLMSQAEFDAKFPIYSSTSSNQEHQEMASNYINSIKNILQTNNPDLSDQEALGLGWVGLHDTDAWDALDSSTQANSNAANSIGRGTSSPSLSSNQKVCE